MKIVVGIILSLLTVYLFYQAVVNAVPNYDSYAVGQNLGMHAAWMVTGMISFFLLRKKKH